MQLQISSALSNRELATSKLFQGFTESNPQARDPTRLKHIYAITKCVFMCRAFVLFWQNTRITEVRIYGRNVL